MFMYILLEIILIGGFIFLIFFMVSFSNSVELEGASSYECGFDISSKTRVSFSYRFFLISILFLIFDVEVALMLPVPYFSSGILFIFFLGILVLGLLFEYFLGALKWL